MAPSATTTQEAQDKLPPLSPAEYRAYNHMAVSMNYYHDHFRSTWRAIYEAVSSPPTTSTNSTTEDPKPTAPVVKPLSASKIVALGRQLVQYLTIHHGIEEEHIFPYLAKKMPAFQPNALHLQQHVQIHAGLDTFGKYLDECACGERSFRRHELKENMDGWGTVLWEHLDQEVETLGAENMRKFWTLEEMSELPM